MLVWFYHRLIGSLKSGPRGVNSSVTVAAAPRRASWRTGGLAMTQCCRRAPRGNFSIDWFERSLVLYSSTSASRSEEELLKQEFAIVSNSKLGTLPRIDQGTAFR
ncbi:hypothetical protein RRG08_045496 [Elysia crispata]|uniref:Uncharacterized protein n=1 Tax=Elysia crispata TaxID=231223 RepID=A0AAE1ADW0_9GAST|nr:hypothetical protein RRG08_045496 [Elysia crispata]